jgi:hypothetical protein
MNAEPQEPAESRRSRWWPALIMFLAGLAIGAIAVAVFRPGIPDSPTVTGPTVAPTVTGPWPSVDPPATAQVNAACLRVLNEAHQVYNIISGAGEAITTVDLRRLDNMVRRLQPLEPLLQRDLQACEVDTGAGPASPTPSR